MPVKKYLYPYVVTLGVFLALDSVWLGMIADGYYRDRIGHLMGPVNWQAAVLFYLVYIAGIVFFAVLPALGEATKPLRTAVTQGAALGFVAYATYDLTNLATLRGWPMDMVVVDICWGTVLTGAVAAVSYTVCRKLGWG